MGLGSLRKASLAAPRRKAGGVPQAAWWSHWPLERRSQARATAAQASTQAITFKEAAAQYIAVRRKGLKNAKHAAQWGRPSRPILRRSWARFWCAIATSAMCTEYLSQPGRRNPRDRRQSGWRQSSAGRSWPCQN